MQECLTKPLTSAFSGCLVEKPTCNFAVRFGFSYLCEHPRHKDFFQNAPVSGQHADRADHNELYRNLKESRRNEYLSMVKRLVADMEQGSV